jgi:hypothetical protein
MKSRKFVNLVLVLVLVLTGAAGAGGSYTVVEDFDSYANTDPELYAVWNDYSTNGSGAVISLEKDPNYVRDGNSVMLSYNMMKKGGKYFGSWMDANCADLEVGTDWTVGGTESLVLYFRGEPGNSATVNDQMWVALEDGEGDIEVVEYDGDANDLTEPNWHEWLIELSWFDACGVNLTDVSRIYVGVGGYYWTGQSKRSGASFLWFDDIRLYGPECELELSVSVEPEFLWPPNGKMVLIAPSWTATGSCGQSAEVWLADITISERGEIIGDWSTSEDIEIGDDGSIYLRARRGGSSGGRVYTIIYEAEDEFGNAAVASATVTVPHNRRQLLE